MGYIIFDTVLDWIFLFAVAWFMYSVGYHKALIDTLTKAVLPALADIGKKHYSTKGKANDDLWFGFNAVTDRIYQLQSPLDRIRNRRRAKTESDAV